MTIQNAPLTTPDEVVRLVMQELELTREKALAWLRGHFGSVSGMSRSDVLNALDKTKRERRARRAAIMRTFEDEPTKDGDDEMSL